MIKFAKPVLSPSINQAIESVTNSGIFVHGDKTRGFEKDFQHKFNVQATSFANCTLALDAAHRILSSEYRIKDTKRNEVICTSMTHVATAHAIILNGLKPVFVDVNDFDGNINIDQVAEAINETTLGIAIVHFNGVACNMDPLLTLAKKHDLYIVEDCAIALGTKYFGTPVGMLGNCGTHSFHPVKQLTTGEGGMIVSQNSEFIRKAESFKAFGVTKQFQDRKIGGLYDVVNIGSNCRMSEIPAAIGIEQLKLHDEHEEVRKNNYKLYEQFFLNEPGLTALGSSDISGRSFYTFILRLENYSRAMRDAFSSRLKAKGVETSVYYPHPIPNTTYYKTNYVSTRNDFPEASRISNSSISLGVGPHLKTAEIEEICKIIKETKNEFN